MKNSQYQKQIRQIRGWRDAYVALFMDAITNDDRKYLIKYSTMRRKLAKIDLYIFLHHIIFHNYEGINNLKHVHMHLPLLNHPKLSQKDKGSFQDHSKILVRLHPTLLDATRWFIRSLWTLLIDVGLELNEFKLIKSHQYHSILLDLPMLEDIGCVQQDLSVWKDGGYDSMTIRTFSLYMGGFFGLDLTWIWNLNSKKKKMIEWSQNADKIGKTNDLTRALRQVTL